MNTALANKVFDILHEKAGASEEVRDDFIQEFTLPSHTNEWRFKGYMGCWCKFKVDSHGVYVDCPCGELTREGISKLSEINESLKNLPIIVVASGFISETY